MAIYYGSGSIGGKGGDYFNELCAGSPDWTNVGLNALVRTVKTWTKNDGTGVYGIQLTYFDGSEGPMHGGVGPKGVTQSKLTLEQGEIITKLVLWGNGIGTRCGRIQMTTSKGQVFDAGKNTNKQTNYDLNTHSGYLVGAYGRSGNQMDQLGFYFLAPIDNVTITGTSFADPFPQSNQSIASVTLDTINVTNTTQADMKWTFNNKTNKTNSWSLTNATTTVFGAQVTLDTQIPILDVGVNVQTSFRLESQTSSSTSHEQTREIGWSTHGNLAPGSGLSAVALTKEGTISNYSVESTIELRFQGYPQPWVFVDQSRYNNVTWTDATIKIDPVYPTS